MTKQEIIKEILSLPIPERMETIQGEQAMDELRKDYGEIKMNNDEKLQKGF